MEKVNLIDTPSRTNVFQQAVLANLQYWQTWLEDKLSDIAAVDRERNGIIRAISFALDFEVLAWSSARKLIELHSPYMERRGYWEIWNHVLSRAIQVAERVGDSSGVISLSALIARLMLQQSRFKEAVASHRRTIRLARQVGDYFNLARSFSNLGYYYVERGYWHRAEVLCCYALKIFEQIDSAHGRAHTSNTLGLLHTRLHHWELAQQYLEQACSIWQAMGDTSSLLLGYTNLGGLFNDSDQPDKALIYLEKALQLADLTGDERTRGKIYMNMGLAHIMNGNLTEAETYIHKAETIFRQQTNTTELARAWDGLAAICFQQGKHSEAILLSEKSLKVWRDLKNAEDEINTLMDLIEYELAKVNPRQATVRLKEVEQLIGPFESTSYRHHLPRLVEIRRNLTEQAAAD